MEKELARRKALRSLITKRFNEFNKLVNEDASSVEIRFVADKLEQTWTSLASVSDEILGNINPEQIDGEVEHALQYEDKIVSVRAHLKSLDREEASNSITKHENSDKNVSTKLPKLSIPIFEGDILNWTGFYEIFSVNVDQNKQLTDIEKFSYLRSLVRGNAAYVINGFSLSSENYKNALDLLNKRYGNRNKILKAHVRELLSIDAIKTTKNLVLRQFVDKVTVHVRALSSLGLADDAYGCFLLQIVLSRLPPFLKLAWARKDPDDNLELKDLLCFLNDESTAIEATQEETTRGSQIHKTTVCSSQIKNSFSCFKCKDSHYLSECKEFKEMPKDQKFKFLDTRKLCHNCFGPNHLANKCMKSVRCKHCKGRHHTLLHCSEKLPSFHVDSHKKELVLPTIWIKSDHKNLLALLDSGSQVTLINQSALEGMAFSETNNIGNIDISGVCGTKFSVHSPKQITFKGEGKGKVIHITATVIPNLDISITVPCLRSDTLVNSEIDMIIGVDMMPKILTGNIDIGNDERLSFDTIFGWSQLGTAGPAPPNYTLSLTTVELSSDLEMEKVLKKIWVQEPLNESNQEVLKEHVLADEYYQRNLSLCKSGRMIVAWPLLYIPEILDTCKAQCYKRFLNLQRRLDADQTLKIEYREIINEYKRQSIIEHVSSEQPHSQLVRYLPHHPVIKESGGNRKIRVVFDASAKDSSGTSLNSIMAAGPNLNPEICELLIRFRLHRFGVVADIEKAFLQLLLSPCQKDLTRFFWVDDDDQVQLFRFNRVIFGAKGSPYLLAKSIRHHLQQQPYQLKDTCDILAANMYVDDIVVSLDSGEQCRTFFNETRLVMSDIKMNVRKWHSNFVFDEFSQEVVSVLGVSWNPVTDKLVFDAHVSSLPLTCTKRGILKWIASFWDPYGILSAFLLQGKIVMRNLWIQGIGWDEQVPIEIENNWRLVVDRISHIDPVEVPRSIGFETGNLIELHSFSDASKDGLGVVVYARVLHQNNESTCSFIMARGKLTPMKSCSIPRLELLAALYSARLVNYVKTALSVQCRIICWTDSKVVLSWINSNHQRWKQFVANRVSEIQSLVPIENWCFVDGELNPADSISRGKPCTAFLQPPPIIDQEHKEETVCFSSESIEEERKIVQHTFVSAPIIDSSRFSSFRSLLIVTAWVFRFVLLTQRKQGVKRHNSIQSNELNDAEDYWVKEEQRKHFGQQIKFLSSGKGNVNAFWRDLRPFLDDRGILRSNRRLEYAELSYDERYPIILPRDNKFTDLLIHDVHERTLHASVQRTISELRNKYWILGARNYVRRIIHQCVVCRRQMSKPSTEEMPPLPPFRVSSDDKIVFKYVGIDFTGPLPIRTVSNEKVYILLITCTRVRAVHLELVHKLDFCSCIEALKRFFFRRGIPSLIVSDNAKTFLAVSKQMEKEYRIKWHFITPYAPWTGGFYERINRSIKTPLKTMFSRRPLTQSQTQTLLCHIEAVINSRPLTNVSDDANDNYILTPAHFISGRNLLTLPSGEDDPTSDSSIVKLWKGRHDQLSEFWKTWKKRYLRELRQKENAGKSNRLNVNDLVLVANEKERHEWPLGIIRKLHCGKDGKFRSVDVECSGKIKTRPIKLIYQLEASQG